MSSEQLELFDWKQPAKRRRKSAAEWKIVRVRETAPEHTTLCETPQQAADYWRKHIATGPLFNPEVECFAVILLNTKYKIKGHHLVSIGSLNETVAHPREVFRAAVIGSAFAIVCAHNHPSGDPRPSIADHQVTKVFCEAGKLLRIVVLDHVIIGSQSHFSMRETGCM